MTEQKYQCPVCHKWYTWDGNFCGLMLAYEGDQPFVCKGCEAEGERLNREFWEAKSKELEAVRHWSDSGQMPA